MKEMTEVVRMVPVDQIFPSRWQPRGEAGLSGEALGELAESIEVSGVINPVLVFGTASGRWELISGERRWRAAKLAGLTQIPVIAKAGTLAEMQEMTIIDNVQREDLGPVEEARAIKSLMDVQGYSTRGVAERLGWSQGKVSQRLSLLRLEPEIQEKVNTRVITPSVGRVLATLPVGAQKTVSDCIEETARKGESLAGLTATRAERMIRDVNKAMQPEWWALPETEGPMSPKERNDRRILAAIVDMLSPEVLAAVVLDLRDGGMLKPLKNYDEWTFSSLRCRLFQELDGVEERVDVARLMGWSCENCRLKDRLPNQTSSELGFAGGYRYGYAPYPCSWWDGEDHEEGAEKPTWCRNWIGPSDPVLILIAGSRVSEQCVTCPSRVSIGRYETYCTNRDCLVMKVSQRQLGPPGHDASAKEARRKEAMEAIRAEIDGYCTAVLDTSAFSLEWPSRGNCRKCRHYEPVGTIPCVFARDPLTIGDEPRAPRFKVLVNQADRRAASVCECFQYRSYSDIPELEGDIRLPVKLWLGWMKKARYSLGTCLSFLSSGQGDTPGDRVDQWLLTHSEELTGGQKAWLLSLAMKDHVGWTSEGRELCNPATAQTEVWKEFTWEKWTEPGPVKDDEQEDDA